MATHGGRINSANLARRAAVLLVLAFVASCGGDSASAPEPPLRGGVGSGRSSTTIASEPSGKKIDPADSAGGPSNDNSTVVELILPGVEPRRELRVRPQAGATQRITARTAMQQSVTTPSGSFDQPMPVFEMDEVRTITSIDGAEIRVEQTPYDYRIVDDQGLGPMVIEEIERSFEQIVDLGATTFTMDDRTRVTDQTMLGEAAMYGIAEFETASATLGTSVPLPAEAVGIGARWRVTTHTSIAGIRMESITDLDLVELDDARVVATYVQARTMPSGFIEGTFDRDEILDGSFDSTGTITWHLDHALPLLTQNGSGTTRMRSFQGGTSTTITIDQQMTTTMSLKN